ncbi:Clp protease ClpP [Mucilaginibacter sp. HMF5004]|uniref:head maturation protease, ClpP-related n=1 Tax=Mucilaginibacter rivuli TaxID=2857527 RepID=UPI001C5E9776|nr:head maturation protease, ClpP-related [Mucilaginibacter rivuli]MBW4889863.1 Clp protease ClpP [Mucilaginibacter rivuli]
MSTTCHIYIYGDIVNIQAPNLGQSGAVSLSSVKDAYNANSACTNVVVHIHSNGGSVFEGFAIHDFLVNTGKPITTVVEGLCCSIATVIFMAGTERKLTENSRFLIHNPWGNAEGNANQFRQYANELEDEQNRLLNFYKQQTGAEAALLQSYMNEEKLISPQLVVELKFATGIIDTVKAMAMYRNALNNPYIVKNQTNTSMEKNQKNRTGTFTQLVTGLKNLLKDFSNEPIKAANKTLSGDAGDLYFDGDLAEGTAVYSDDAMTIAAADGDYEFEDGTTISVANGLVTNLTQPNDGTGTNDDPTGKAIVAALRKKLALLKAEKQELENAMAESETVLNSASKALQLARSTYRPDKRENRFNRPSNKTNSANLSDKMEARRAELKAKKQKA